jgi:serine/threonine-protein kinase
MVMGTPGFMSPEQMMSRKSLTLRSDLFALGIVAYCAATGAHPFGNDQRLVGRLKPTPPAERCQVQTDLSDAIMWMLAREPARRPRSGREVIAAVSGGSGACSW